MLTFQHMGETYEVKVDRKYANGNTYVEVDLGGEPFATLSVNMPPYDRLPDGVFFLKDWSENVLIAASFIESGLVERADDFEERYSGFVAADAYRFVADGSWKWDDGVWPKVDR